MSIIIGLCIKKFEKKKRRRLGLKKKNNFENVFGVDNQTVNEKKIEKVINKEIKKKKRSAWCFLATKKILQTCLW